VLLLTCLMLVAPSAESTHPDSKLEAMLADALAVIRINDPRWLDREVTKFAATLGIDPAPLRSQLGRLLFRCQALDGIDLTRPALLAWRTGPAPLLAIIPLTNRRLFLDGFGVSLGDDAPLIRIGERDGTVVYSQNTNDGLVEYRLLVSDQAAYLARTTEECRALSEHVAATALGAAPLSFTANAAFLAALEVDPFTLLPDSAQPALARTFRPLATVLWHELITQLDHVTIDLHESGEDGLLISALLYSLPMSQLGVWVGNQRNQPGHLLSVVRTPTTVLSLSGSVLWQGQGERLGQIIGSVVKHPYGASWTGTVDELWRGMWAILDRSGPFASALDLEYQGAKSVWEGRYLAEQQRAPELVTVVNSIVQTLGGQAGDAVGAASATGFHQSFGTAADQGGMPPCQLALLSNERQVVAVLSASRDPVQVAGDIFNRSANVLPPEAIPCIGSIGINFTPLLRALVQIAGGAPQPILPSAETALVIKAMPQGQLSLDAVLPVQALAQLVRDSGIQQTTGNTGNTGK